VYQAVIANAVRLAPTLAEYEELARIAAGRPRELEDPVAMDIERQHETTESTSGLAGYVLKPYYT
jgi:hypothetical protein